MVPYELMDMVLFNSGNLDLSVDLHRSWISKKIIGKINIRWISIKAAQRGHLNTIRWLYKIYSCKCIEDNRFIIVHAVKYGHLNLVKWLYYNHHVSSKHKYKAVVYYASYHKRLDIIEWFHINTDVGFGSKTIDFMAFHGHLWVV
jgi:hypothetical protein